MSFASKPRLTPDEARRELRTVGQRITEAIAALDKMSERLPLDLQVVIDCDDLVNRIDSAAARRLIHIADTWRPPVEAPALAAAE